MAITIPANYNYAGTAPNATTNQYGFGINSLNFQPATDFGVWNAATIAAANKAAAPAATVAATPAVTATPTTTSAPTVAATPTTATAPVAMAAPTPAPAVMAAPTVTAAPTTYSLPAGFTFKAPAAPAPVATPQVVAPPPVATPTAAPVATPTPGPVVPPSIAKTPVMTTPAPIPVAVDPRVAALKNSGYTDAQIAAAGGAGALLQKINAPTVTTPTQTAVPVKATSATSYTWGDLNNAVAALKKVNPNFTVQGIPLSKWSTNGVASLAKTDANIFKALKAYLPTY